MSCYKAMARFMLDDVKEGSTGNKPEHLKKAKERQTHKLPKVMKPSKKDFEAVGFSFKDLEDDVLCEVTLPEGWTLRPRVGYWSDLIDEKGRRRGSVFYKNVFYDRKGHIALLRHLYKNYIYVSEESSPINVCVTDEDDNIIFSVGKCKSVFSDEYYRLMNEAQKYLNTNFPDWTDPTKYWD